MRATVIADASYCNRTNAGGWAAWIAYDGGSKGQHHGTFRSRPTSSTIAEYQAVLNGIWLAYQRGARKILVQTDCMTVVHAIGQRTGPLWSKWHKDRPEHFPDAEIRAKHVKGHTQVDDARSYCNRWCDTHAKKQMRKQRDGEAADKSPIHARDENRGSDRRGDFIGWGKPLPGTPPKAPSAN